MPLWTLKLLITVLSEGPAILQKLLLLILLAPAPDFLLLIPLRWNTTVLAGPHNLSSQPQQNSATERMKTAVFCTHLVERMRCLLRLELGLYSLQLHNNIICKMVAISYW